MLFPNQDAFERIVKALGPYLDELVFVGAWCQRLLRFHQFAVPPTFAPLMSEDADVATPERLAPRSESIAERLRAAGFRASLSGSELLPVSKYYPDDRGLYVEFIAPLRGGGHTRNGERDDTLSIAGITAAKLRYVDLLLHRPWTLELKTTDGFPVGDDRISMQLANPVSYLAQKVLSIRRRPQPQKRAKDALYVHDTLLMFGEHFDDLRPLVGEVLALLPRETQSEFHRLRVDLFHDDALVLQAADIAAATGRASPPSASTVAAVCVSGLERIFAATATEPT
jgi:Nucleotidyltransferase